MGCITLVKGQALDCEIPDATYSQRIVLLNADEVDRSSIDLDAAKTTGKITGFKLIETKKGVMFKAPPRGVTVQPTAEISFTEAGVAKFKHNVPFLVTAKAGDDIVVVNQLTKGKFVAVVEFNDETYHLVGIENGLFSTENVIDLQGGGGASVYTLASVDGKLENLPMLELAGVTKADFEDLFLNPELEG